MMDYTVKWLQQEVVATEFFMLPGKVHDASHTSPTFAQDFGVGTLLFTPGPVTRSYTLQGVSTTKKPKPGWDYTAKFKYNPYTWNKYYRADQPGTTPGDPDEVKMHFAGIYRNTSPNELYIGYPLDDLTNLLPT